MWKHRIVLQDEQRDFSVLFPAMWELNCDRIEIDSFCQPFSTLSHVQMEQGAELITCASPAESRHKPEPILAGHVMAVQ